MYKTNNRCSEVRETKDFYNSSSFLLLCYTTTGRTGSPDWSDRSAPHCRLHRSDRSHGPVRPVYAKQKGCTLSPQVYNSTTP